MLIHLTIKNYALIQHLEMDPSAQLNVITGETGAGKSIMLGAIGLLLGNRADSKALWDPGEKCIAEAVFNIAPYRLQGLFEEENLDYEDETVLRREVNGNGKSRAFINDTPVTLDVMRKIGGRLMDVHSQHETLDLASRAFQLHAIDTFATHQDLLTSYQSVWSEWVNARNAYESLQADARSLQQEADYVQFQLKELTQAALEEGDQERIESELKIREHAEDIKARFNRVLQQLDGTEYTVTSLLANIRNELNSISAYSPAYQKIFDRVESLRIELKDIQGDIEQAEIDIDVDPRKTESLKERLDLLYHLLQKHRMANVAELLKLQSDLQQKADKTANLDEALHQARTHFEKLTTRLDQSAKALSASRKKVFKSFCARVTELLKSLGIVDASLHIGHEEITPGPHGMDQVEMLFSANKGIPERPLATVASGGEFSRLMFCLKYILAEKTALPTLVLDEIDTGVSGEIAIRLGKMMKAMAQKHQLIAISHLPQIAAKADCHFFVYKETRSNKTVSEVRQLNEQQRIEEIAKMIGGEKPSDRAKESARELISN